MTHTIVNQKGKYIIDQHTIDEIVDAINKDKTSCEINGVKVEIELDVKCEKRRLTKVIVEGI